MITMKNYEPKQLLADHTLIVKCMSELTGQEVHLRKVVVLAEFR